MDANNVDISPALYKSKCVRPGAVGEGESGAQVASSAHPDLPHWDKNLVSGRSSAGGRGRSSSLARRHLVNVLVMLQTTHGDQSELWTGDADDRGSHGQQLEMRRNNKTLPWKDERSWPWLFSITVIKNR